jgi:hypothetical protein
MSEREKALNWLAIGEVGTSSKTIACRLLNLPNSREYHPSDPDDLSRCIKLLNSVPEFRERLDEMKVVSPAWKALVEHWEEVEALFHSEMRGQRCGRAPKTYERMKELGL